MFSEFRSESGQSFPMPLMHARTRGGGFDGLLEEPHGCGAEEGQERGPAEDVHVGHQGGLLLHHAVEQPYGTGAALGTAEVLSEVAGDSVRTLLQDEVGRPEVGARSRSGAASARDNSSASAIHQPDAAHLLAAG